MIVALAILAGAVGCTSGQSGGTDSGTTTRTSSAESSVTTTEKATTTVSIGQDEPIITETTADITTPAVTQTTVMNTETPTVTQTTGIGNDESESITTKTTESVTKTEPATQTTPKPERPEVPITEQQSAIDKIAEKYNAMGISVALIDGGRVTDTYQYGWAVENERPMDEDTKIRVASLSKVVLTMLAMQMYDEDKLEINAPFADYFGVEIQNPAYPEETITLRHLFTHVSSLTSRSNVDTWEKMQKRFSQASSYSEEKPGDPSAFAYNNYAFGLIGTVMDSINGITLDKYARATLFEKLGIEASFHAGNLDPDQLAVLYRDDHTVGLSMNDLAALRGSDQLGADSKRYAGGLTVSAKDLATIISVLCNDGMYGEMRVLSKEAVELMETRFFHFHNASYDFDQALTLRYQSGMYGREGLYYHTGSAYGVYSFLSYDPETGSGIVVVTTGAPKKKDKYDIYAVCGEISDYFYKNVLE